MAEKKISQLTAKGANLASTDLFAIAEDNGAGGYNSKYITGSEVNSGMNLTATNTITTTYTFVLADKDKLVISNSTLGIVATIPTNASVAYDLGTRIELYRSNTGAYRIVGDTGVTLTAAGGADKLNVQYSVATILKIATDSWILYGDITT
tara:strand:- start:763 stop:1215 length:453 start_codon:yes stop_codon:yes gene_type:complete